MVIPKKKGDTRKRSPRVKKKRKSFFLHGMITILPAVLTLFILMTVVRFVQDYVTAPINGVIYWTLEGNALGWKTLGRMGLDPLDEEFIDVKELPNDLVPEAYASPELWKKAVAEYRMEKIEDMLFFRDRDELYIHRDRLDSRMKKLVPPWISVVASLLVVFTLGSIASGFVGRRMIASVDNAMTNVPVVRAVYPYAKKLVTFFLDDHEFEFETVVAAPYPTRDVYAIAFVTSQGLRSINEALEGEYVSLFVPTSPMPMTGYTVFIESHRLIPLSISVDEALRVTVSAGVLIPPSEQVGQLEKSLEALGAHMAQGDAVDKAKTEQDEEDELG